MGKRIDKRYKPHPRQTPKTHDVDFTGTSVVEIAWEQDEFYRNFCTGFHHCKCGGYDLKAQNRLCNGDFCCCHQCGTNYVIGDYGDDNFMCC